MIFGRKITTIDNLILVAIVALAIFFRTNQLEGKMTFEWDQSRDFEAVETMLSTHKPALLGPIVRGDAGGLYLGPFYYYLITPLYIFSAGNPLSLSLIGIGCDVILIYLMYIFLRHRLKNPIIAFIPSLLWACSPLIINNSYTPWNVSLIPIWVLIYIWIMQRLSLTTRFRYLVMAVFFASLTTNIHLSLIPLAGFSLIYHWQRFLKLRLKQYATLIVAAVIPVSTLIIHDLLFHFENTILLKRFLFGVSTKSVSMSNILALIIEKFGYTVGRLFTGEPYTYLGLGISLIVLIYGFMKYRKSYVIRYSLGTILIILFSLLIYRDADFAEYYFIPAFVPLLILLAYASEAWSKYISRAVLYGICAILVGWYVKLGISTRSATISPYSLTVKKEVVIAIRDLGYPIEFRTNLPRERNTGFLYLMKRAGVVSDTTAVRKAYIYEANNLEIIAPPEARSIILEYPIKAFKIIVFSN